MVDGKGHVRRDHQELAAAAQERLATDIGEHFPLQEEQESETWQDGPGYLRRFHGEFRLHVFDVETLPGPVAPLLPIRNDSFHKKAVSSYKYTKNPGPLVTG